MFLDDQRLVIDFDIILKRDRFELNVASLPVTPPSDDGPRSD